MRIKQSDPSDKFLPLHQNGDIIVSDEISISGEVQSINAGQKELTMEPGV